MSRDEDDERIARLHRRTQQLEGPFQAKLAELTEDRNYWKREALRSERPQQGLRSALSLIRWHTNMDLKNPISQRVSEIASRALDGKEIL